MFVPFLNQLLAAVNSDLKAFVDQLLNVVALLMIRNTAHRNSCRLTCNGSARKGKFKCIGNFNRVLLKELKEISHANHNDMVGKLLLHLLVLAPNVTIGNTYARYVFFLRLGRLILVHQRSEYIIGHLLTLDLR